MAKQVDLVVIGAGPGGYVAAIRAAQYGMKVVCVDKRAALGGTCLNVGCIPSKALLHSSHLYSMAEHEFKTHGISCGQLEFDLKQMIANKDAIVKELNQGIAFLFKKNKVEFMEGSARFKSSSEIEVVKPDGSMESLMTNSIIIATGSEVASLPGIEIDEKQIVSSTGALSLGKVPESLIVVGGGYIGLEMGSVWRRLGSQVTVVEFMDRIVPQMDLEVGKSLHKVLEKQGMSFMLSTRVASVEKKDKEVVLNVESAKGGDAKKLTAEVVLMSVGRKPASQNLGLKEIGVAIDDRGFISVDHTFQTSVSGIYAIGDVIKTPMLAHVAEEEGIAAVDNMNGRYGHVNYDAIPAVVYTHPEVATVGKTEEELKAAGIEYKVGKFPFMANSRAKAIRDTEGFVKILADAKYDKVLGAHIIGPDAGTLLAEIVSIMEFGGSAEDIAMTCHAHPTLNEAVKEAALAVAGRAIHI